MQADAGQGSAGQGDAARETLRDTRVSEHWEVVCCSPAKWAMAELIALSSESDSDEILEGNVDDDME
jgi:hypothetical protein